MQKKQKILIIHNIITPIRNYYFNHFKTFFAKKNIDFKVIFLSHSDKNRHWKNFDDMKFEYEVLDNFAIRVGKKDLFTFFVNLNLKKVLQRENPDVIICAGWDHFAAYYANYWCRKNKKKFILWSGSTNYEKSWRRRLFNPLVKYLVKRTQHFFAYGTRAKQYLENLGANSKQIQILWNTCDLKTFKNYQKTHNQNTLKKNLGLQGKTILLFNGQIIERKGIFELISGFKILNKKHQNFVLLLIGKGQAEKKLKKKIQIEKIKNIRFLGHLDYHKLPEYYSLADLFILPSEEEVWGLVINEAMACGLPILTNKTVGASSDLVKHGQNGYIMQICTGQEIVKGVDFIIQNGLIEKNNSAQIIQDFELEKSINKLKI